MLKITILLSEITSILRYISLNIFKVKKKKNCKKKVEKTTEIISFSKTKYKKEKIKIIITVQLIKKKIFLKIKLKKL